MEANAIDRLVLAYHACESQRDLDRFWDGLPEHMHQPLHARLTELFPPDPDCCDSDPYARRARMLARGMSEPDAAFFIALQAQSCASRAGRTVACERCETFVADYGPGWAQ